MTMKATVNKTDISNQPRKGCQTPEADIEIIYFVKINVTATSRNKKAR